MLSFIDVVEDIDKSGTYDEAEERSEIELLVRATPDNSEPADDTVGEALPKSGELTDGDETLPCPILAGFFACDSVTLEIDGTFASLCPVAGPISGVSAGVDVRELATMGKIGMVGTVDAGSGAGGLSSRDGNVVLTKNVNVEPLLGTPVALMSPPCK